MIALALTCLLLSDAPTEKSESPIPRLTAALDSDLKATRDDAADVLAALDPDEVWKGVKTKLRAGHQDTRRTVLRLIRTLAITHAAGDVSRALRSDDDAKVRREAAHTLASIAPDRAVDPLTTAAFLDRAVIVRRAAIQDLGRIGTPEASDALVDVLERCLESGDEYLGDLATRALTLATGQSFGDNLEGWRHWLDRAHHEALDEEGF